MDGMTYLKEHLTHALRTFQAEDLMDEAQL